jgi:distribution and morphology protein 34
MHAKESDLPRHTRPSVLAADQPLIVPMLLRISDLKLRGIVVLVVSKTKGITLVFKNDPLESILVSSTFDSVTSVRSFLQREIENQLRNLFQEDLPVMIHNLSLRHIQSQQEKQEHEEWLKAQQLRVKSKTRSVFSDPVNNKQSTSNKFDTFSMPDLEQSSSSFSSPRIRLIDSFPHELSPLLSPTSYSSFSDLYFVNQQPVTAANLSTLNALYSSRFAALKTPPPYSDYNTASQQLQENTAIVDNNQHDDDDDYSSFTLERNSSSVNSIIAAELYADDVDAPWYVTEGPELPSINAAADAKTLTMMAMDEDIILNPKENLVAAKLAKLAAVNHTISPFAHTIDHFTFRSLPHTVKVDSKANKHKKKPKRRIIRWNSTPTTNTTTTTTTSSSS